MVRPSPAGHGAVWAGQSSADGPGRRGDIGAAALKFPAGRIALELFPGAQRGDPRSPGRQRGWRGRGLDLGVVSTVSSKKSYFKVKRIGDG